MKNQILKIMILLLAAGMFYALMLNQVSPVFAAQEISFDRDIRPIFAAHCVQCHNEKKQSGGLRLDAKSFAVRGSIIVPRKSAAWQKVAFVIKP